MHAFIRRGGAAGRVTALLLLAGLAVSVTVAGIVEEKLDVLQIGARTYTNVTVTTKAKDYVFILHGTGMASIKVAELPDAVKERLGYPTPATMTNTAKAWAKREMAKINVPQVQALEKQFQQKLGQRSAADFSTMGLALARQPMTYVIIGAAVLFYMFYCYCLMLICRKTGNPGGFLVWLPLFQIFPMLRAAGMSYWWILAYFVPLLNIVPPILWCFKIAKARGKSAWVGLFLLLPITGLFAFLYLAFSDSGSVEEDDGPEPKVMTLQTV